ncbi:hypothetical protein U1Q18_029993 [Sarracenia purpurea var. burkii]
MKPSRFIQQRRMKARWGLSSQASVIALLTWTVVSPRCFEEAYPIYAAAAIDPSRAKAVHSPPRVRFIGTFVHLRQSGSNPLDAQICCWNLDTELRASPRLSSANTARTFPPSGGAI